MLWKNPKELGSCLREGRITDKHAFVYLLVQLALICVLLQLPFEEEPLWWVWLLVSLGVIIGGVSWTYKLNRNGDNKDYLLRFISISYMAVLRCLLLVLVISSVDGILAMVKYTFDFSVFRSTFQEKLLNVIRGFILIFYFVYMLPSFKRLNAEKGKAHPVVEETQ